jgi:hypothetical protein
MHTEERRERRDNERQTLSATRQQRLNRRPTTYLVLERRTATAERLQPNGLALR